jgi:hypothetical protein
MHVLSVLALAGMATAGVISTTAAVSGSVEVINKCRFPVQLESVFPLGSSPVKTLAAASTETYKEQYRSSGGISIKIARGGNDAPNFGDDILQVQYTAVGDGKVWYNVSYGNCKNTSCPFSEGGVKVTVTPGAKSTQNSRCEAITVPPHTTSPVETRNCPDDASLQVVLCP